jgi:sulfate transport system ATP-binding protein
LRILGQANVLRGRLEGGRAYFGAITVDAPEVRGAPEGPAVGYVRPHDLELARDQSGGPSLAAIVRDLRLLGPIVRVEMEEDVTGASLEAEAPRHELVALGLVEGDRVFVRPRKWQVFATRENAAHPHAARVPAASRAAPQAPHTLLDLC